MIMIECPKCGGWQALGKSCNKCGHNFKANLIYVTKINHKLGDGKYKASCKRWPGLSLDEVREKEFQLKREAKGANLSYSFMYLSDVFRIYYEYICGKNPRYSVNVKAMFTEMLGVLGDPLAKDLTRIMVLDMRNYLKSRPSKRREGGLENSTVNAFLRAGHAAYAYVCPDCPNPFKKINSLPTRQVVEFLTPEEEGRLVEASRRVSQELYEMILVTLGTGFRKTEVLSLRRTEVDLKGSAITKTVKGGRTLTKPLLPSVRRTLEQIEPNLTDYFWVSRITGKPHPDMTKAFEQAKKLAGIDKSFRWHGLRHHVAFKILRQRGNLEAVRRMLGHTNLSTTARYIHMMPDDLRNEVECLEQIGTGDARPKLSVVGE